MAHQKQCQNCSQSFTGNISKRFCSDACRKYYKRHGEVSITTSTTLKIPDKAGLSRTSPRAGKETWGDYILKKGIDIAAKYTENALLPDKPNSVPTLLPPSNQPLFTLTAEDSLDNPLLNLPPDLVPLSPDWQNFLGLISYPFKMLVWGAPGSGKSTFCMQLANQIATRHRLLYMAGEEALSSQTLVDKQRRLITEAQAKKNCVFLNRLPATATEWKQAFQPTQQAQTAYCSTIFYDSVTQLGISPFYIQAAAREFNLPFLTSISHIFITHAHKDGQQYRGDGSWGHEVDIIVRVEKGVAKTEKNRFGQVGQELTIY